MPTNTISLAHEALAYASHGILIFPLWHVAGGVCTCSDGPKCGSPGKHPRNTRGVTGASHDMRRVERWWHMWPDANIGMPMGGNGLAAVDIDPAHGGGDTIAVLDAYCLDRGIDPRATRLIRTGSGGEHRIYWQPPGGIKTGANTFGDDAPGVDTRGRGGYLVAPPSLHASGQRYEVIDNGHRIAPWPTPLTELLEQAAEQRGELPGGAVACGPRPPTAGDRGAVWAFNALLSETKQLADLPAGEGNRKNDALNIAAYKLGRRVGAGYLTEADVTTALLDACRGWTGHTERELRATIRSGLTAGMQKPHEGPTTRGGAR